MSTPTNFDDRAIELASTVTDWCVTPHQFKDDWSFSNLTIVLVNAYEMMDAIYYVICDHGFAVEAYDVLFGACHHALRELEVIWYIATHELDTNEQELARGDLFNNHFSLTHACGCACIGLRVTMSLINSARKPNARSAYLAATARALAGVEKQYIAQYSKPIHQYNAVELIRSLNAISACWFTMEYNKDVARYVALLALRFGFFLKHENTPLDYGENGAKDFIADVPAPALLHNTGTGYTPSCLFRDLALARLSALMFVEWQCNSFETHITPAEHVSHVRTIIQMAEKMDLVLNRRPPPARPICGNLVPRPEFMPRDGESPMDLAAAAIKVARLLVAYCNVSMVEDILRENFGPMLAEMTIAPGDTNTFRVHHRWITPSPDGIHLLVRGNKYMRSLTNTIIETGPFPLLVSALDKLVSKQRHTARSALTIQEEIACLCAFSTLVVNKFDINWQRDYLRVSLDPITGVFEYNADEPDTSYTTLPQIRLLANEFVLTHYNVARHTNNICETLALWLFTVDAIYDGAVPLSESSVQRNTDIKAGSAITRDIKELCSIVRRSKDYTDFTLVSSTEVRAKRISVEGTVNGVRRTKYVIEGV